MFIVSAPADLDQGAIGGREESDRFGSDGPYVQLAPRSVERWQLASRQRARERERESERYRERERERGTGRGRERERGRGRKGRERQTGRPGVLGASSMLAGDVSRDELDGSSTDSLELDQDLLGVVQQGEDVSRARRPFQPQHPRQELVEGDHPVAWAGYSLQGGAVGGGCSGLG